MRISDWSSDVCSSDLSELSQGLYPQAPELAKHSHLGPAEQFWIIKHGVKLSAMPRWGKTHPDPLIWDMVAFVRRLPGMSAAEYQRLVASAPQDHDARMQGMKDEHMRSEERRVGKECVSQVVITVVQ